MCNCNDTPEQITGDEIFYTGPFLPTLNIQENTNLNSALQAIESWASTLVVPAASFKRGTFTTTANGLTTVFNIPHTLGQTPVSALVNSANANTSQDFSLSWNSTNIIVTFAVAPAQSTQIALSWVAFK